jgi:hypothetical protein
MQVGKNVAIGVGVAFLGLLAIVFFLLGRESNRRQPAQTVEVVRAAPVPELPPVAPAVAPDPAPRVTRDPPPARAPDEDTLMKPGELGGNPFDSRSGKPDDAIAVRDYFIKMDSIQVMADTTDTGEFANKLLASAVSGDMSGFDSIVAQAESSAERARAISPPAVCRSYNEKMLALLGQTLDLVKGLAAAIKRNDMASLSGLSTGANAMQKQVTAVEAEGRALKTKYGIH